MGSVESAWESWERLCCVELIQIYLPYTAPEDIVIIATTIYNLATSANSLATIANSLATTIFNLATKTEQEQYNK